MVQVKHTARKTSVGLTPARHPYVCTECRRELSTIANFRRHMIAQHGKNLDGSVADEATIAKYKKRTGRSARVKPTAKTGADRPAPFAPATLTDEPTPTTSAMAATSHQKRRPNELTTSSSSGTSVSIAKDLEISSSTDDRVMTFSSISPMKSPTSRSLRVNQRSYHRWKDNRDASRYSWTPVEQRDRVDVVRGMRAMAAASSARIRRRLPLTRTDADVQRFLTVVRGRMPTYRRTCIR